MVQNDTPAQSIVGLAHEQFRTQLGNSNWGLVNNPEINQAMGTAELVVGVQAWGAIARKLVAQAVAIPFDSDKAPKIESKNFAGVGDPWSSGAWHRITATPC